jgi:hypothetical protein
MPLLDIMPTKMQIRPAKNNPESLTITPPRRCRVRGASAQVPGIAAAIRFAYSTSGLQPPRRPLPRTAQLFPEPPINLFALGRDARKAARASRRSLASRGDRLAAGSDRMPTRLRRRASRRRHSGRLPPIRKSCAGIPFPSGRVQSRRVATGHVNRRQRRARVRAVDRLV